MSLFFQSTIAYAELLESSSDGKKHIFAQLGVNLCQLDVTFSLNITKVTKRGSGEFLTVAASVTGYQIEVGCLGVSPRSGRRRHPGQALGRFLGLRSHGC
mgnify:CR=1 FL=1